MATKTPALRGNWSDHACYYVVLLDGSGRYAMNLLAGPYQYQCQAEAKLPQVRTWAEKHPTWCSSYMVCVTTVSNGYREALCGVV